MMYWNFVVVLVPWAALGLAVGAPEELRCGRGCHCWTQTPTESVYRVICNETTTKQKVALTEAVFRAGKSTYKTYVRVETAASVVVTKGFVEQWRQYHSCALDIWCVDDLQLPETTPFEHNSLKEWRHVFAGVGLVNVSVDSLPAGLFSGKQSAGLRLTNSSVGRISSGLLGDVKTLKYLEIRQSSVGLLEGPLGREDLVVEDAKGKSPVFVLNSTVGRLGEGALRLTATSREDLVFQGVTLGQVAPGAVSLFGRAKLVLDRCQVADLHQLAITLHNETSVAITNSSVVARPGALSGLPCAFFQHHIHSNQVVVLPDGVDRRHSLTPDRRNRTEDLEEGLSIRQRLVEMLETVLHPTCVEGNLPPWLLRSASSDTLLPPLPEERKDNSLLQTGLYSFVAGIGIVMIIVLVLTCLLVRARRRRPRQDEQVVVMSQLTQDSIYEDPSFIQAAAAPAAPPPLVPPPNFQLAESVAGKGGACRARDDQQGDDCCAVARPLIKAEENTYVFMR